MSKEIYMKSYRLASVCFFLLMTAIQVISQGKNPPAPFFFIQVTDPQFGFFESNKGFSKETELYQKAVSRINRLQPDFIVITGDLVNNKDDKSQIAEFKRITSMISPAIPVWFSPGNHDIGQIPAQKDIDTFVTEYGHDRFSFRLKDCLFIGLNSCLIKSNVPILEQLQFEWLSKELTRSAGLEHIIVFTHYPFFINAYDEPETYSNIPVDIRNRYLDLFKKYNVDAVFAGHLHNNASAKYGEMEMVTTSSVGRPLAKAPSGLRIVIVYPDRIESSYYTLDEIPEKIIL
jgi:3',5'-cyclic AMP phosphodiesterase CpdA